MKRSTVLPLVGLAITLVGVGLATAAPSQYTAIDCKPCWEGPMPCGGDKLAACTAMGKTRLEDYWQANTNPSVSMLRPSGSEMPRDVRVGKYKAYAKGAKAAGTLISAVWPSGTLVTLPVDRVSHKKPEVAATAHRHRSWDTNDQKVTTCEEYGYEQIYDVGRFLDAANACAGDDDCLFDVAFMPQTPGLAGRVLERKDGEPLGKQLELASGKFPKNDLFQFGRKYLYSNGRPGATGYKKPPLDTGLQKALEDGEKYYKIDVGDSHNNVDRFASEWEFHRILREKNRSVTPAEREEYDRRKAKFRALTAQLFAAMDAETKREKDAIESKYRSFVLPYDMQTFDPFERYDRVREFRTDFETITSDLLKKYGPSHFDPVNEQIQDQGQQQGQQQGAMRPRSRPAAGVLGALGPSPVPTPSAGESPGVAGEPKAEAKPKAKPKAKAKPEESTAKDLNPCLETHTWGQERMGEGPISCKIGQFLRGEWARKKAGFKSCLDLGNTDCDWEPEMLRARILDQVPLLDEHVQYQTRCKAWTTGTFSPAANNLDAATKIIDDNEKIIGTAWRELEPYYHDSKQNNAHGVVYDGGWDAQETYGDKDWFAAKVAYDLGWDVTPSDSDAGGACELKGGLRGDVDISAWFHDRSLKYRLIDGNLEVQVNKGTGANAHKARYKAHLVVKNQQVFVTGGADDVQIPGKEPEPQWITASLTESEPFAQEKTKRVSFQYWLGGFIPITGSIWGELTGTLELKAEGKSPTGCNAESLEFRAEGQIKPTFHATGYAQVGVGVVDLASAGVRGAIDLFQLELPLDVGMNAELHNGAATLVFDSSLSLVLRTLSGRISVYLEFLLYDEEWELFRWKGVGPATAHLMPKLTAKLPIAVGMRKKCAAAENCL